MTKESFIVRNGEDIKILKSNEGNNNLLINLVHLDCNEDTFFIKPPKIAPDKSIVSKVNDMDMPWIGVKDFTSLKNRPGYRINRGDIIKFGRIKVIIREIKLDEKKNNQQISKNDLIQESINNINMNTIEKKGLQKVCLK